MFIKTIQTSDLTNYKNQIIYFTKTLTIKYEPIVEKLNDIVVSKGGTIDIEDYTSWKYYKNIQGEYHPTDTLMYINSLDTGEKVLFSKETLDAHVKTRTYYRFDTIYYTELCNRYPDQIDLIKNILYPCDDVHRAYYSKNCTILGYDKKNEYLESTEQEYLISKLQEFLTYIDTRWYYDFLKNENYFYWAFWALLWYIIPNLLYAFRVEAIKTPYAHTWHIWQYLMSKGLDDYSDALDRDQTMFLYKNIDYIMQNVGKQSTLIILVENLLSVLGVGLYGKDIEEQTVTKRDQSLLTPEYTPLRIPTLNAELSYELTAESTQTLNDRLYNSNLEVNNSNEWVNETDIKIGNALINRTATKFLELRMLNKNKKYAELFFKFMFETLIYCADLDIYNPMIEFVEPLSGTYVSLTVKEALVLLYYVQCRIYREMPVDIPTKSYYSVAFSKDHAEIPSKYKILGQIYEVESFIDLKNFLNYQKYPFIIKHAMDFSDFASSLFIDRLNQRFIATSTNDYVTRTIVSRIGKEIWLHGLKPISLSPYKTYDQWFSANNEFYEKVIQVLEGLPSNQEAYVNFNDILVNAIMPHNDLMSKYGNFTVTTNRYKRLKELLTQLTSYNIVFLDTESVTSTYLSVIGGSFDPYKVDFEDTISIVQGISVSNTDDNITDSIPQHRDYAYDISDTDINHDSIKIGFDAEFNSDMDECNSFKFDGDTVVTSQENILEDNCVHIRKYFKFKSDESLVK